MTRAELLKELKSAKNSLSRASTKLDRCGAHEIAKKGLGVAKLVECLIEAFETEELMEGMENADES